MAVERQHWLNVGLCPLRCAQGDSYAGPRLLTASFARKGPADFTPPFSVLSVLSVFSTPLPVPHTPLTGHPPHFPSRRGHPTAPAPLTPCSKAQAVRRGRRS